MAGEKGLTEPRLMNPARHTGFAKLTQKELAELEAKFSKLIDPIYERVSLQI